MLDMFDLDRFDLDRHTLLLKDPAKQCPARSARNCGESAGGITRPWEESGVHRETRRRGEGCKILDGGLLAPRSDSRAGEDRAKCRLLRMIHID